MNKRRTNFVFGQDTAPYFIRMWLEEWRSGGWLRKSFCWHHHVQKKKSSSNSNSCLMQMPNTILISNEQTMLLLSTFLACFWNLQARYSDLLLNHHFFCQQETQIHSVARIRNGCGPHGSKNPSRLVQGWNIRKAKLLLPAKSAVLW